MTQAPDIDRVEGCLLGIALGDALGLPMEGMSGGPGREALSRPRARHGHPAGAFQNIPTRTFPEDAV
jgi:ADP-ribosylglycohydrolase